MTEPADEFIQRLADASQGASFTKLVLGKPRAGAGDLQRVTVRPVVLKGEAQLSFVHTHQTKDITKNLAPPDALAQVRSLIEHTFLHAHLFTTGAELQLLISQRGKRTLVRGKASPLAADGARAEPTPHDRAKHRFVEIDRPFLAALGVTAVDPKTGQLQVVPAMARKWKQINKFIEVLHHAIEASALQSAAHIRVADFGSGKGYLTFAMHDHLRHTLGRHATVTGVELRADMVALCNGVVQRLGLDGLHFEQGDVSTVEPPAIDIMVALHACDTATDHAIHTGLAAGARIIMCSPCCHKELRPQLLSPHPLRPLLKHGVHLGQQAEMLTDGLRAMLLDACGYDAQVFEFVALEHTNKNKMILAVKREQPTSNDAVWEQIRELKGFYGIQAQCLETLLLADRR
jgi:SAM-dependent methyltransferase